MSRAARRAGACAGALLVIATMSCTARPSSAGAPASQGAAAVSPSPRTATTPSASGWPVTLHYASNTGDDRASAARAGYNLFDMNPDKAAIDALAPGQRALVWLGNLDNTSCTPGYSWAQFTAAVDQLAGDRKVFGYYLSDEPHPRLCPDAVAHIRQRADYIRAHDPSQLSFIVVLDGTNQCGDTIGCEYAAMRPDNSHVDLIGLDPFPCKVSTSGCDLDKIDEQVLRAQARGVPRSAMVPVYQVFGQTCPGARTHYYALPSQDGLRGMLARWSSLLPRPAFDFSYTWRSAGPACPGLADANGSHGYADLQAVMREHNARH